MAQKKGKKRKQNTPPPKITSANKKKEPSRLQTNMIGLFILLVAVSYNIYFLLIKYPALDDVFTDWMTNHNQHILLVQQAANYIILGIISFFAYQLVMNKFIHKNWNRLLTIIGIMACISIYSFVIHEYLSLNGDNASYAIGAQSLSETGQVRNMHLRGNPVNSIASIGLPLLLSPVYEIWGMDILKMKLVVWFFSAASVILFLLLLHKYTCPVKASLIGLVVAIYPPNIAASSFLMTEGVFIFMMCLFLYFAELYSRSKKVNILYLLGFLAAGGYCYLTRSIGIACFPAIGILLLSKISYSNLIQSRKWKDVTSNIEVRKAFWLIVILVLGLCIYVIKGLGGKGNPITEAFGLDLYGSVSGNLSHLLLSIGNRLNPDYIIRWMNVNGLSDPVQSTLTVMVVLLVITGLLFSIRKQQVLGWFLIFSFVILVFFNPTEGRLSLMPTMRYVNVYGMFLIYILFVAIENLLHIASKRLAVDQSIGLAISLSFLILLLPGQMSANGFFVSTVNRENYYTEAEECYFELADWCKENLPKKAFVASRKPRLFYLYSGLKGIGTTTLAETYSEQWVIKKMSSFKARKVNYLILGSFSTADFRNIYPMVQNYPQFFEPVKEQLKNEGNCYVLRLKYDAFDDFMKSQEK